MDVLRYPVASRISATHTHCRTLFKALRSRCFFTTRSSLSLPFPEQNAKHYEELKAAVDVVERACHLCVEVQKSLSSSDGKIVQKIDRTPVTIADFGVQALVSLEMGKLFPSIPLVAEEDSTFLRENNLTNAVVEVVKDKYGLGDQQLSQDDVLKAIDRGGKDAYVFGSSPATYWVLDPIDGTRGFVKGREALYVVGLALVVEGEIVLGVMGCPNWQEDYSGRVSSDFQENNNAATRSGIIMISHVGCGTWRRQLRKTQINDIRLPHNWIRCSVDGRCLIHQARFCIPESQTWESLPLSCQFNATTHAEYVGEKQILLLPTCCGSLCKYLMVSSGRVSVFFQCSRTQRAIMVWDHAVGIICVHEAGGKVTDWRGSELDLATDEEARRVIFPSSGILVTNNRIHNQVLEMISSS